MAAISRNPCRHRNLNVVYLSTNDNKARLAEALGKLEARYLDPAGRQVQPDGLLASIRMHLLETSCGRVDVLRTVGKDLAYLDLEERTRVLEVADSRLRVLKLEMIIETKEHADRPKDRYQLLFCVSSSQRFSTVRPSRLGLEVVHQGQLYVKN